MTREVSKNEKVHILLVDDTPSNLFALEVILEDPRYELISVSSARQGLEYLAQHEVALILTDVMMPIMDGFEFAKALQDCERLRSIPIIFLTAMAKDIEHVFRGYTCGAVDYIQKPLTEEIVRAKVEVFVQFYRQKASLNAAQEELLRLNKYLEETVQSRTRELQESENRLLLAKEAADFGMWDFSPKSQDLKASAHLKKLLGIDVDEDLDFTVLLSHLHLDDREKIRDSMINPPDHALFEQECRFIKGEDERWFRFKGRAFFDDQNQPYRFIGMVQDITTNKRNELVLQEQAQLLNLASDIILARNLEDKIIFWNRSAELIYGWNAYEALGQNVHALLQTQFPKDASEITEELIHVGYWQGELKQITRSGKQIIVSSRWAIQLQSDGKISKVLETNTDITAKKIAEIELKTAKENAEAANHAKSAFLANMSHEIRTPLGAILGFSELIREPEVTEYERLEYIETIHRNGEQLSYLIDEILDLSKIEAGKLEMETVELSLPELMNDVMISLGGKAREKNIDFRIIDFNSMPETIVTDPIRLRQILLNIIGNAVKFTESGFVHIETKMQKKNSTHMLMIAVHDSGVGIEASAQQRLFQTFAQADPSTTRRFGGTGLGLVLSQKLASALGGDLVLVRSEAGRGSTFAISIQADAKVTRSPSTPRWQKPKNIVSESVMQLKGLHVLLAEDQQDNQLLISRVLTKHGASVDMVANGIDVVRQALEQDYDVILMDMQMPLQDGYDSTRVLRQGGYSKPIIALTAHAFREEREKSLRAGCDDHLPKPISHQTLISTLRYFGMDAHANRLS